MHFRLKHIIPVFMAIAAMLTIGCNRPDEKDETNQARYSHPPPIIPFLFHVAFKIKKGEVFLCGATSPS